MKAIYVRQSIDKKGSLSIEGQIDICKKLAGEEAKVYIDRGFSGKNTNRPAFTELIEDVKAGKVNKIYVYRLDRFSRIYRENSDRRQKRKYNMENITILKI